MITSKEYNELVTLIANLRDESINFGQRLYQANSGAWFNQEAYKYSQDQVDNATQILVDYLKRITK